MPLIRPLVERLHAYVPGEQPKVSGLIKLNTNENPYPPSPAVLDAIKATVDGRLRLYPNPTSLKLREKLAKLHRCKPENILVGNGSDELLALATRCFVEPWEKGAAKNSAAESRSTIQYLWPCYSLYPVLADIHGSRVNPVNLKPDFSLPTPGELKKGGKWDFRAALTLVTTPNAPTGRGYSNEELDALCQTQKGVVILDEAYVDFAVENALELALKHPHVLIALTFSKAYALCFQRVGYFVGHPRLIQALEKIKDSYNVNGLGQIAAEATLDDLDYYRNNFKRIIQTREQLTQNLSALGFEVFPSQTNFIFTKPPKLCAQDWLEALRSRKILIRWFKDPTVSDYLRITIGTDAEAAALIKASKTIVGRP